MGSPAVLNMLENNYKLYCTWNMVRPRAGNFKGDVIEIVEGSGIAGRRSNTLDADELLSLMRRFHQSDIYFGNIKTATYSSDVELFDPVATLQPARQPTRGAAFRLGPSWTQE